MARDHFRAHARRRVDLDGVLRLEGAKDKPSPTREVHIRDLGLGGAGVEISERPSDASGKALFDRDVPVVLEVTAPTLWDPLPLAGKVAWFRRGGGGRPARAGIRFEHREPGALYALFQLLGAHLYDV